MQKLAIRTRGRLLKLGKLDEKVKNILLALRFKQGVVNTVVAIVSAKTLTRKSNGEHLILIELEKSSWARSFFQRMGFTKRAATTRRPEILDGARKMAALIFHYKIVFKIEKNHIPHTLILNMDQTLSKLASTSRHTLAKKIPSTLVL